jgi:hypothetical protein
VLGAARDADVLLLLTEWQEFSGADPGVLAGTVARRAIVDARHALDADAWRTHGWDYRAPGRPVPALAAAPAGTAPAGTAPAGTAPSGTAPSGTPTPRGRGGLPGRRHLSKPPLRGRTVRRLRIG